MFEIRNFIHRQTVSTPSLVLNLALVSHAPFTCYFVPFFVKELFLSGV